MSNQEIIEKLQILQSLLIASVTNETANNQEYVEIRNELFGIEGLKQALPSFVRTCSSLGQFWGHIKREGNLPRYADRREYVWNAFKPLIEGLEDDRPVQAQVFFPKGATHDAYTHIRAILQEAKESIFIIDGYMDGTMYTVLSTLTANLQIRILTSKVPNDFSLEGRKFRSQHTSLVVAARTTKDFHDRFIVIDGKDCYLLGASIKDAGNKSFTIVPLKDSSVVQFFLGHAEDVWSSGAAIF